MTTADTPASWPAPPQEGGARTQHAGEEGEAWPRCPSSVRAGPGPASPEREGLPLATQSPESGGCRLRSIFLMSSRVTPSSLNKPPCMIWGQAGTAV